MTMWRIAAIGGFAASFLSMHSAGAENIKIKEAIYGTPEAQKTCVATRAVARACDGKQSCTVEVDNNLCGDPNGGVVKKLMIKYGCGSAPADDVSSQEGANIRLSCE